MSLLLPLALGGLCQRCRSYAQRPISSSFVSSSFVSSSFVSSSFVSSLLVARSGSEVQGLGFRLVWGGGVWLRVEGPLDKGEIEEDAKPLVLHPLYPEVTPVVPHPTER
jgi:hypothetical protein